MAKNLQICLLAFLVMIDVFCKNPFKEKLVLGEVYNPNLIEYQQEDIGEVFNILKDIFHSLEKKDLNLISKYISEEKGVFVDLKAFKTKQEFLKEINNPGSYIHAVYLNTNKLIEITKDPGQISIYDLLKRARSIKAEFYVLTPYDIEVKLILIDNPKESYRFNNPYFIKIDHTWYIYRLF